MRLVSWYIAVSAALTLSACVSPDTTVSLEKLGGRWVNTDTQCRTNASRGEFCEFIILPHNAKTGEFQLSAGGVKALVPLPMEEIKAHTWEVRLLGGATGILIYRDGQLIDESGEHYRLIPD